MVASIAGLKELQENLIALQEIESQIESEKFGKSGYHDWQKTDKLQDRLKEVKKEVYKGINETGVEDVLKAYRSQMVAGSGGRFHGVPSPEKALEAVSEKISELEKATEVEKKGFFGRLANRLSNFFDKVEERAGNIDARADEVKEDVRQTVDKVQAKASDLGQKIEDKYREARWNALEAGDRGINAINALPENTLKLVKNIGKVIDNGAERYGNAVDNLVVKTEKGINQAGEGIKNTVKQGQNAINQGLDRVADVVDAGFDAMDRAGDKMVEGIGNAAKAAQGAAQNVGSKIKQSASWAADKLREGKTMLQEKFADPYKPDMYKPCKLDVLTEINPDKNYSGKEVRNQLINEMARLGQDNPQVAQFGALHANKMFNDMAKNMDKQAGKIDGKYASHQLTMTGQQIQELAGQMMEGAEKDLSHFAGKKQDAKSAGISTFRLRNTAPEVAEAFGKEMKLHVSGALAGKDLDHAIDKVNGALVDKIVDHNKRQGKFDSAIGNVENAQDATKGQGGGKAPVVKGKGL